MERTYVLSCRLIVLIFKFAFTFIAAKILTTSDFSEYIVLASLIVFSVYFVGLDFYSFSNRELVSESKEKQNHNIKNHGFVIFIMYVVFGTVVFFTPGDIIGPEVKLYFFIISIGEHFSLEVSRILNIKECFVKSATLMILKVVPWILSIIVMHYIFDVHLELTDILLAWSLTSILLMFFSLLFLSKTYSLLAIFREKISVPLIIRGLKVCSLFLVGTLAVKGLFTYDKQMLKMASTAEYIVLYGIIWSAINAVVAMIESGVIVFKYPRIIAACKAKDLRMVTSYVKELVCVILCIYFVFYILFYLYGSRLLDEYIFSGKQLDLDSFPIVFSILCIGSLFNSLSNVPHYIIYGVAKYDRFLLNVNLSVFSAFAVAAYCLREYENGVAISLASSFGALFLIKSYKAAVICNEDLS
ncbi:hypothetical protein [Vibrio maritimus]|uniref:hypothetical protein n=1 Tax=Vibrio maritimus TaxID=990268 RepID=UPI001F27EB82|nr:hypothetical protein [Vibrio maritimus]